MTSVRKLRNSSCNLCHIFDEVPFRPDAECSFYNLFLSLCNLCNKKVKKQTNKLADKITPQLGLDSTKAGLDQLNEGINKILNLALGKWETLASTQSGQYKGCELEMESAAAGGVSEGGIHRSALERTLHLCRFVELSHCNPWRYRAFSRWQPAPVSTSSSGQV